MEHDPIQLAAELRRRAKSPWKNYSPTPHQLEAHLCPAKERIVLGGNRAGKSTWAAFDFAARVLKRPIVASGKSYELPDVPKINGTYWVVGRNQAHISQTIYRLLFEPGLIKIVEEDGKWRPFDPNVDESTDAESCDPLISKKDIDDIVWESEKERMFKEVRLKNGNIIRAYGSGQDVKKGDPVLLIWIDEDIKDANWLMEGLGRLIDTDGRLNWSATPDSRNFALIDMVDKARDQEEMPDPDTVSFSFSSRDNPYLPKESVERAIRSFNRTGDAANRIEGDLGRESISIYPMLERGVHVTGRQDASTPLLKWLDDHGHAVPGDCCHYLVIDPGHTAQAAVFICVPPPDVGPYWLVHDEVVVHAGTREDFAKEIAKKARGRHLVDAVIDACAGRQHHMGDYYNVSEKYYHALKEANVGWQSEQNYPGLPHAVNAVREGIDSVRQALEFRQHFGPRLYFHGPTTQTTVLQMERYRKATEGDKILERPARRQVCDLCDVVRYGCMRAPEWESLVIPKRKSPAYQSWLDHKAEQSKRHQGPQVIGAGGPFS